MSLNINGTDMELLSGGIDIFYIDESGDRNFFVLSTICIPFMRNIDNSWQIVWPDDFELTKQWRRDLRNKHRILIKKELHSSDLLSGRGNYRNGRQQFSQRAATNIYRDILSQLSFLPEKSIMSVVASRSYQPYGMSNLEASLHTLFQRMRQSCLDKKTNGLIFFDQGHGEYRKLYRRSLHFLLTGSQLGGWGSEKDSTRNIPLRDFFVKDGNEKNSKFSNYIQIADLIAYAAFLKVKAEHHQLTDWQNEFDLGKAYDSIPIDKINTDVTRRYPTNISPDGILRLPPP